MKNFGIIAHPKRKNVAQTASTIIDWLKKHKLNHFVCDELGSLISDTEHVRPRGEIWKDTDCVLSLGGDGTMLASIRAVGHHGIPVFGINVGGLGFLTEIFAQDIPMALEKLKNDDYFIETRMVLQADVVNKGCGTYFGLNDVVLDHGDSTRLVKLDLYGDSHFVCSYNADGLIVSTPTGSTAYNLAAGGPVMHPYLGALIACPICPHSLTLRPIIFDDKSELLVRVASEDIDVRLTIDGQVNCTLDPDAVVKIKKAPHVIKLVRIKEYSFFEILRTKLHWGARPLTAETAENA